MALDEPAGNRPAIAVTERGAIKFRITIDKGVSDARLAKYEIQPMGGEWIEVARDIYLDALATERLGYAQEMAYEAGMARQR